ncbi:hypothetical protein, partial [Lacticaseibacillus paracasei]|uniref:hypothetical protein n=1 Tax=Lacticaseibacillus paracasei TaxID=1597 RepID=UPI00194E4C7A
AHMPSRRRRLVTALLVALIAVVAGAFPIAARTAARASVRRCNGMVALCDRRVGDVAFPTAHNAMSSPADHFRGPNQGQPMRWQLEHGIRGFQ